MKTCTKCSTEKDLPKFRAQAKGKFGVSSICRECHNAISREWFKNNKERVYAVRKIYKEKNAEAFRTYSVEYRAKHSERLKELAAKWTSENMGIKAAATARRRATKIRATPKWADLEFIKKYYILARKLTKETGIKANVDHVVPLQSKIVCGLHCEANLSITTEKLNKRKGNLWWPDMP